MMRILLLLTQDLESPSGLGRFFPLARELSRMGHSIHIAALHPDFGALPSREFTLQGVQVHYVAPMHVRKRGSSKSYYPPLALFGVTLSATWQLGRAVLSQPVDIIHIGKPHPMNSLAGLLGRRRSTQIYLDCDDYEAGIGNFSSAWQRRLVAGFENWTPKRVDFITTNTHFTHDRLVAQGISPQKIFYLSNGVDRSRFEQPAEKRLLAMRKQLDLQDRKIVAFIGSLSRPGHPVDLLFQAFARLRIARPDTALLLVGGGDDFERLQAQARAMGLGDHIIFCGRVPPEDVSAYYHLADVSVDPVHADAAAQGRSPLKLFESWACSVPFVSADVGDRRLLLGNPPAGLLAQPGDADSLAAALAAVLNDPDLAAALRQRGMERVQGFYWDVLAKDLEAYYQRNLPGRS